MNLPSLARFITLRTGMVVVLAPGASNTTAAHGQETKYARQEMVNTESDTNNRLW